MYSVPVWHCVTDRWTRSLLFSDSLSLSPSFFKPHLVITARYPSLFKCYCCISINSHGPFSVHSRYTLSTSMWLTSCQTLSGILINIILCLVSYSTPNFPQFVTFPVRLCLYKAATECTSCKTPLKCISCLIPNIICYLFAILQPAPLLKLLKNICTSKSAYVQMWVEVDYVYM